MDTGRRSEAYICLYVQPAKEKMKKKMAKKQKKAKRKSHLPLTTRHLF